MKTKEKNSQVNLSVLKLQRSNLDKQTAALFITMMVMTFLLVAVLQLNFLSENAMSAITAVLSFGLMYIMPVFIYKNVKLAWTINDIDREMRKAAVAPENIG